MDVTLWIAVADGPGRRARLAGESLTVGRAESCDVRVSDRSMSRRHARLFRGDDGWYVEDLGSRNGTYVDGLQVRGQRRVRVGQLVSLGGTRMKVLELGGERGEEHRLSAGTEAEAPDDSGHSVFFSAREILEKSGPVGEVSRDDLQAVANRLRLLNEVHQALSHSVSSDELLEMIMDRVFEHLRPEEAGILLSAGPDQLECAARRPNDGGLSPVLLSRSVAREVIEKGVAALVLDAQSDDRFQASSSVVLSGVRSLAAAPLLAPDGPLGVLAVGSRYNVRQFDEQDVELLTSLASVAAMRLRNLQLAEAAAEQRRLEEELALARRIQLALLPDGLPELPGWSFWGRTTPSRGVSGDFFKLLERRGGELVLLAADVSGKGMAASLLTGSLEALTAMPIEEGGDPGPILEAASRLLYRRTPREKFATAFLAAVESASGRLRYASAGHDPALVVGSDGEIEQLEATGLPLGLFDEGAVEERELSLEPGATLVVYTDGIPEAENPDGEPYGLDRLCEVCRRCPERSVGELAEAIEEDVAAFTRGEPFGDDRTLVLVRRLPSS